MMFDVGSDGSDEKQRIRAINNRIIMSQHGRTLKRILTVPGRNCDDFAFRIVL